MQYILIVVALIAIFFLSYYAAIWLDKYRSNKWKITLFDLPLLPKPEGTQTSIAVNNGSLTFVWDYQNGSKILKRTVKYLTLKEALAKYQDDFKETNSHFIEEVNKYLSSKIEDTYVTHSEEPNPISDNNLIERTEHLTQSIDNLLKESKRD